MGLGSLAAGLQHEIKNPLSALSLHIQLLCERFADEPHQAEVDELLDVLRTEVQRINNVLDGFRNYASVTELGRTDVDVRELIGKLVRLLRPQASQQGVQLEVEFPNEPLALVQVDSVRLEQVLLNLAAQRHLGHAQRRHVDLSTAATKRQSCNRRHRHRSRHPSRNPSANFRSLLHDTQRRTWDGTRAVRQNHSSARWEH